MVPGVECTFFDTEYIADSGTKSRSRRAENCRISKLVYPAQRTSLTVRWLHTKNKFEIRFCTMYSQDIVFLFCWGPDEAHE